MAITHGRPNPEEGRLFNYLWKDPKNNKVYCYDKEKTDSKAGELFYQLLEILLNKKLLQKQKEILNQVLYRCIFLLCFLLMYYYLMTYILY
jgi:hypothetical protein